MVDRGTDADAWNQQEPDALVRLFHRDMVWPWPLSDQDHDPITWVRAIRFGPPMSVSSRLSRRNRPHGRFAPRLAGQEHSKHQGSNGGEGADGPP